MRLYGENVVNILIALVAGISFLGVLTLFFWFQSFFNRPLEDKSGTVISLKKGETALDLGERLKEKGVISGPIFPFLVYLRLKGWDRSLKPARVVVEDNDTLLTLIKKIVNYREPPVRVVISEGMDIFEVAERLASLGLVDREEFIELALSPSIAKDLGIEGKSVEGYLFPDTYFISKGTDAGAIIRIMVDNFREKALPLLSEAHLLPSYETLIVASLIQKETYYSKEMPYVAAVIYNRLKKGMPLQVDPTVIYAYRLMKKRAVKFVPKPRHLKVDSPYNTYRVLGLPPTPICSPGIDAIRAAVHPADVPYLFFVSKGDGTHHFSKTLREHTRAVNRYLKGSRGF